MGKSEEFLPLYIQKERAEKARRLEQEKEDTRKRTILEARMREIMSRAVSNTSLDLTLRKFGDISSGHENDFQRLRREIENELNQYLERNPEIGVKLYETGMAQKNTQEILVKELSKIYDREIKGIKPEGRDLTTEEKEDMEKIVLRVVRASLNSQNPATQRVTLKPGASNAEIAKDKEFERREKLVKDFIMSLAMQFFKANGSLPKDTDLLKIIEKKIGS